MCKKNNELPNIDKQLIEPCLKKVIVERSLEELQDIITGNNKKFLLKGYKKAIKSKSLASEEFYISDKFIDEDVILLKKYFKTFWEKNANKS